MSKNAEKEGKETGLNQQAAVDAYFLEREMDAGKAVSNYRAELATSTPPTKPADTDKE